MGRKKKDAIETKMAREMGRERRASGRVVVVSGLSSTSIRWLSLCVCVFVEGLIELRSTPYLLKLL